MQSIYAMHQNSSDNSEEEKISYGIDNIQDLYLTMISSLMEICKRTEFLQIKPETPYTTPQEQPLNEKIC
jgi:N utilization substance protein B